MVYATPFCSHLANPTPFYLGGNIVRIFFSSRNLKNKAGITFIDLDIDRFELLNNKLNILFKAEGYTNTYFRDGISLGNIFSHKMRYFLSFMGWDISSKSPWEGRVGIAEIDPFSPSLLYISDTPIIETFEHVDSSLSYPMVRAINDELHIWYGNTLKKDAGNGDMLHTIHLSILKSDNSLEHKGQVIDYEIGKSQAFSRPTILEHNGTLNMLYSVRGISTNYRIKRVVSNDGFTWEKADFQLIGTNHLGEQEMQCYPYLITIADKVFLFYNGNEYGRSGMGIAILEQ